MTTDHHLDPDAPGNVLAGYAADRLLGHYRSGRNQPILSCIEDARTLLLVIARDLAEAEYVEREVAIECHQGAADNLGAAAARVTAAADLLASALADVAGD